MSRADAPAFSVVIPCRNEATTLPACLDALEAQDFPSGRFEVLLVDGGSTDGSCESARRRGVRVLRDGGRGPSGARNIGIRASRAPLVAFTDADCAPFPDWLTRLAEVFAEDPTLGGVAGGLRMARRSTLGIVEDAEARVRYRGFITSNVAYRRDVLLALDGFAEDLCCAEDYDLAWRVLDAGWRIARDPRPVVLHDPPETSGSLAGYLRKQAWYARHDVPTHARAIARARSDPHALGSASALPPMKDALREAAFAALVGGGALAASAVAVGAGLAGAGLFAAPRAAETLREAGEPTRLVPAATFIMGARSLARGAGTLLGLADLARPSVRRLLSRSGPASRAPLPARPAARARARAPSRA